MQLFGFDLFTKKDPEREIKSVVADAKDDGAHVIDIGNGPTAYGVGDLFSYSTSFDLDADALQEAQLIAKYREIAVVAEVESAIDDIINEFVSTEENDLIDIDLDELPYGEPVKKKITDEFQYILKLLDFNSKAYEIIKRWYVDGRLNYQVVVTEEEAKKKGISKLVYIDPRHLRKVRVIKSETDPQTKATLYSNVDEFYMFSETGFIGNSTNTSVTEGVKLTADSVASITSGLLNSTNKITLSFLHKAIRPLNLLKSLEDASAIYTLSRAPERRIFYIDVGNLPPHKADEVMRKQMQQFKTKAVFDPSTGLVKSDAKHMTMVEDYWLPRNASGRATEISTLPSGQALGDMDKVQYFLQKLYKSLNVPVSRLDQSSGFMFGRVTEISRDEVKFNKFIERIRRRFNGLFLDLLKKQLVLKGIMTSIEFESIKQLISFEYASDNMFNESLDNERLSGRLQVLSAITEFEGVYFSKAYIQREVLRLSQEDIDKIAKEIDGEGGPKDDLLDASRGRVEPPPVEVPVPVAMPGGGKAVASAPSQPTLNSSKGTTNAKPSTQPNQRSAVKKPNGV